MEKNVSTQAPQATNGSAWGEASILLLLALACVVFWSHPALTPLKVLVVFFHEGSHALATLLTGGTVIEMEIVAAQGGHVLSRGGWPFVIISAGYLGSLLWGSMILVLASRSKADRAIMAALGIVMLSLTVLYVRNGYGLSFGLLGAALALASAKFLPVWWNDVALKFIGLVTMMYVPLDIFSDTLARSHLQSDARILADYLGGPTMFWGALWLLISVASIALTLYLSLRPSKRQ